MPREIQEWRRSYIDRRADELALTGGVADCHAIEVALRLDGYMEVYEVLAQRRTRLSAICAEQRRLQD